MGRPPNMAYSSSKTALNAITVHYARSLAGTHVKGERGGTRPRRHRLQWLSWNANA